MLTVRANHTNPGGATLNLNSIGAKKLRLFTAAAGEGALAAGQIQSGGVYQLEYNTAADSGAGAWIVLNPTVDPTPPGAVQAFAGAAAPAGWLLCDGASYLRTDQAALFAVIGTTYGAADGTHFNVPDLRGRAVFGREASASRITAASGITSTSLGATGGADMITLSTGEMPVHGHPFSTTSGTESQTHTHGYSGTTGNESATHTHAGSGNTGGESVPHTHSVGGTTGTESADHTHGVSATTGTESAAHSHGVSGTTGAGTAHHHALSGGVATGSAVSTGSAHTHNGTTGTESQSHSHTTSIFNGSAGTSGTAVPTLRPTSDGISGSSNFASGNASVTHTHGFTTNNDGAHSHSLSGITDDEATHTHAFSATSATESETHTHSFSTTSAGVSANHAHTFSATSGVESAGHTHDYAFTTGAQSANHTHNYSGTTGNASVSHTHSVSGTTDNRGGGLAHVNMPPAMILNWIIKA
jgi:microcystin-dependent protein